MFITYNSYAVNAHNNMKKSNQKITKTMEALSSGDRINRAADDAAGLAISEKMRFQLNGARQAASNIQDGISLVQTAEGGLAEVHAMLQRMNQLAVQAATGTYDENDRRKINLEFQQLNYEIDNVARSTKFNDISLLSGGNGKGKVPIRWQQVDTGTTTHFYDIEWNGSMFLAVGKNCNSLVSKDGVNWYPPSTSPPPSNVNLHSVKWDGEQFLVIENHGVYTTKDGYLRTGYGQPSGKNSPQLFDAKLVGGKYVAVGEDGTIAITAKANETNAKWTTVLSGTNNQLSGVASNGEHYVAVGKDGTIVRSEDAIHWSVQKSGTGNNLKDVIWENNQYVAVGDNTILTSKDGVNWNQAKLSSNRNFMEQILYDGHQYVALSGSSVHTSKDGLDWETSRIGSASLHGLAWNGKEYISIGMNGKAFIGRTDAVITIQKGSSPDDVIDIVIPNTDSFSLGLHNIDLSEQADVHQAIEQIKSAIDTVSNGRARLGGDQNRLEHALNHASNYAENLAASESRIKNTDMAEGIAELTRSKIIAEAGQAMLAQANTLPNMVLQLLK
ncbi:flagellin [Paenibacillus apiarius]|uniref:flagellin n=1 Tax=Paenibacillus apiarius TaxID=46240 RepID=UPI00197EA652|nr:flagellin [Paenibacillus apiarius]MBN3523375.1 flagellin [Paenibacillus apiarius]